MCAFWKRVLGEGNEAKSQSSIREEANQVLEELYRNRGKEIIEFFTNIASTDQGVDLNNVLGNAIDGIRMKPIDRSVSKWSIPLALCLLAKDDIYGVGIFQSTRKYGGKSQGIIDTRNVFRIIPGAREKIVSWRSEDRETISGTDKPVNIRDDEKVVYTYEIYGKNYAKIEPKDTTELVYASKCEVILNQFDISGMSFSFCFISKREDPLPSLILDSDFFKELENKVNLSKKLLITETALYSANSDRLRRFPIVLEKEAGLFG